jgi:hypothetical protein
MLNAVVEAKTPFADELQDDGSDERLRRALDCEAIVRICPTLRAPVGPSDRPSPRPLGRHNDRDRTRVAIGELLEPLHVRLPVVHGRRGARPGRDRRRRDQDRDSLHPPHGTTSFYRGDQEKKPFLAWPRWLTFRCALPSAFIT